MHKELTQFKDELMDSEKCGSAVMLLRASQIVSESHTRLLVAVYGYMRSLDQIVDEGADLRASRAILEGERSFLYSGRMSDRQVAFMGRELSELSDWKRSIICRDLVVIMNGMEMDLRIRETGQPMDADRLGLRHLLNLWPVFNSFSVDWYGREIKQTEGGLALIRNYGEYDALCDLEEDLTQGLVLISDEKVASHNIELQKGGLLAWDKVEEYYLSEREHVQSDLKKNAKSAFHMGLPTWAAAIMYVYMYKRSMRLNRPFELRTDAYQKNFGEMSLLET